MRLYVCFHPIFIAYIIKYIRNLWFSSRVNEFSGVRGDLLQTNAREWPQFFSRRRHPICLQPLTKHRSRMTKRYSLIKNTGRVVCLSLSLLPTHSISFHLHRPEYGGNECKRFVCCFCLNLAPKNFSVFSLPTVVSTPFVDSTATTSSFAEFFDRCQKMLLPMRCPNGDKYNLQ